MVSQQELLSRVNRASVERPCLTRPSLAESVSSRKLWVELTRGRGRFRVPQNAEHRPDPLDVVARFRSAAAGGGRFGRLWEGAHCTMRVTRNAGWSCLGL